MMIIPDTSGAHAPDQDAHLEHCLHASLGGKPDLVSAVTDCLQQAASLQELSKSRVAERLNVSCRTLSRKLSERNLTFQCLLDAERQRRCSYYLLSRMLTGAEFSELLGFSDTSYFYRAFRSWTGRRFSEVKQQMAQKHIQKG